jgi:hypothetical protein
MEVIMMGNFQHLQESISDRPNWSPLPSQTKEIRQFMLFLNTVQVLIIKETRSNIHAANHFLKRC